MFLIPISKTRLTNHKHSTINTHRRHFTLKVPTYQLPDPKRQGETQNAKSFHDIEALAIKARAKKTETFTVYKDERKLKQYESLLYTMLATSSV